jgi:hypothetical protein
MTVMQEMLRTLVLAFWSDGGQGSARRNAWAGMVADAKRARERAEADVTVKAATDAYERTLLPAASNV